MAETNTPDLADEGGEDVAIIAMAGRFPGAADVEALWRNLCAGVESVSFFSDAEVLAAGADPNLIHDPNYVKARAVLDDVELFDAAFFGLSPREAAITDPQHRVFLECAWEALEAAGYEAASWDGRVGVYAATTISTYLLFHLLGRGSEGALSDWQIGLLNEKDALATRVSYKLNLTGPSVTVQSACSSSLVSVHLARQSLLNYECDMALAGGVTIRIPQRRGYLYHPEGILSPDGHCRAFDARAQGVVFGSGAGVVVLRRLEDALADRDPILAVIKGSAVNNDGAHKVGYTAPGLDGQVDVIAKALALAEVDPRTIGYVETHGTGTALGDAIEIAALTRAFGADAERGFCAIGSVKTNVGHLDSAAGVAGLVKTVQALRHRQIPPSLHFEEPNPRLELETSPFYVNDQLRPWESDGPRRAGVSAFGIGGTNAHVVLEEAPPPEPSGPSRGWQLLLLSAQGTTSLEQATDRLAAHLRERPDEDLADVAYTLQVGRARFDQRRMLVCAGREEAHEALAGRDRERLLSAAGEIERPAVAFMFPGQGAQHVAMGLELYDREPTFRGAVDRCAELLAPQLGADLRELLYPAAEDAAEAARQLDRTRITQPALFVVEYALARLWMAWGVRPQAMIGHSIGEYVAAHLAGVFSLEDALTLVAARGRLMEASPEGAMLAVPLAEDEVVARLGSELSLAAVNAPERVVVSGPEAAVAALAAELAKSGVEARRVSTSHAFHSPLMDSALAPFQREVGRLRLEAPQIPYLSNLTGRWIEAEEATDPDYWMRHLRHTVRFNDGLAELLAEPDRILLEVGPGRTLASLARRHPQRRPAQAAISSLRHPRDQSSDLAVLLGALGQLWMAGVTVDWAGFYAGERRRRVALPTYPFARQRHWIEAPAAAEPEARGRAPLGKRGDVADWFYLPSWKRSLPPPLLTPAELAAAPKCWLLFADRGELAAAMAADLRQGGHQAILVRPGEELSLGGDEATIDPRRSSDYEALLGRWEPQVIVHLGSVTPAGESADFAAVQEAGFDSLHLLFRALGAGNAAARIGVVSTGLHAITGEEELDPAKATLLGACAAARRECPELRVTSIDLAGGSRGDQILSELAAPTTDPVVAYRGPDRWLPITEPVRLASPPESRRPWREHGLYLLTGGLGAVGFEIVRRLATAVPVRLAFLEPVPLPPREEWPQLLAADATPEEVRDPLRKVQELEAMGAEVMVLGAELTDPEATAAAVDRVRERFGAIHGVLHLAPRDPRLAPEAASPDAHPWELRRELARKTEGALVLDGLLRELDFFVLFSAHSEMPVLDRQAAHGAASAFLNALAEKRSRRESGYAVAIDWGQNVGFRDVEDEWSSYLQLLRRSGLGADDVHSVAMTSDEAFEVLSRILGHRTVPRIIVSTQDAAALAELAAAAEAGDAGAQERPELTVDYVAPHGPVEERIAAIWQEVLGVSRVGAEDDFFDLGGDSLVALQVVTRLREALPVELQVQALFDHPTVATLGLAVEEALTEKLEQLTEEEARQLMASLDDEGV